MKQYFKDLATCLLIATSVLSSSCSDDKFDPETARKMYEDAFPAKDISSLMDWRTIARASVTITMSEVNDESYEVVIFSADPTNATNKAQVLTQGYVSNRMSFQTKMDYPNAISTVYVFCRNTQGSWLLKTASIDSDRVSLNFETFTNDPTLKPGSDATWYKPTGSPLVYTYAFEDNYPRMSDFDFNDLVIDVTQTYVRDNTNKVQQAVYTFKIRAAGGINGKGTALRLIGINKSQISKVEFSDPQGFRSTLDDVIFPNVVMETDEEVVIPIVGNVAKLFGYDQKAVLNTGIGPNINPKSMTMTITLSDQSQTVPAISMENLDFFLAYGSSTRTEIHLYEFRKYGPTARGTIHEKFMAVAGKITWALCIPNFTYPFEFIRIGEAYPQFRLWAASGGDEYKDWYKHVNTNTDRTYIFND